VCGFVALVIQHAKRMHRITLSSVACPALPHFSTLSQKRHNCLEEFIEQTMYFDFLYNSVSNISHTKKNSSRYYHKSTQIFIWSTRYEVPVMKYPLWSTRYEVPVMKYPLFLPHFNETWIFPRVIHNFKIQPMHYIIKYCLISPTRFGSSWTIFWGSIGHLLVFKFVNYQNAQWI
jgi:hypothetical protein